MLPSTPQLLYVPRKVPAAAGGSSLLFTATDVAQAWTIGGNSPYNFTCNIGTAAADRIVVVCVCLDQSASNVTGVTANGTSLTPIVSYTGTNGLQQAIYASSPGGVSGSGSQTVAITTVNAFPGAIDCMVGTITGSATASLGLTNSVIPSAVSNDPHAISIASVPANGVAIISTQLDSAGALTLTWTGTSSSGGDSTVQAVGANSDYAGLAHGTSNSVSFTCGSTGRLVGILMAAWGP